MAYRLTPFLNHNYYHIYNRGVEKRLIFLDEKDYQRFYQTLYYYQFSGPKPRYSFRKKIRFNDFDKNPKIVEVICFCFMPNHYHLLLRQLREDGVQEFIKKVSNSYTKYFNTRYKRVGPLFQGQFKAVQVESDEQLLHLSRYIHLNPYVSGICQELEDFGYSSYLEFMSLSNFGLAVKEPILTFFKHAEDYRNFIKDYQNYAKKIYQIRHLTLEDQ